MPTNLLFRIACFSFVYSKGLFGDMLDKGCDILKTDEKRWLRRFLSFFLLVYLIFQTALGQSTQNGYSFLVYQNLELLEGNGLIPQGALAQRPLSEKVILSLLEKAEEKNDKTTSQDSLISWTRKLIGQKTGAHPKDFNIELLEKVSFSQVLTSQKESRIESNGLSGINAIFQPLLSNRQGRMYQDRFNSYLETNHALTYKDKFAIQMQPQLILNKNNAVSNQLRFQKLLFKANLGIAEISVGRENVVWGLRSNGGLLFSDNAPPLDMIKIATSGQIRLPWFLKQLGTFSFASFVADLGKDYARPHAKMATYRFDYQPTEKWNFGIEHTVTLGGTKNQNTSAYRIIGEFTGFLIRPGDPSPSNHNISISAARKFWNLSTYVTIMFEDTDNNLDMLFIHNASWLFGMHMPNLGGNTSLSLNTELIRSGPRAYRHGIYSDGHAINRRVLGFGLGPDVFMSTTSINYSISNKNLLKMNFQYLNRSGNSYQVVTQGNGDFVDLEATTQRSGEKHYIVGLNWIKSINEMLNTTFNFGLDYTNNKNFVKGEKRLDYMLEFSLEFTPGI